MPTLTEVARTAGVSVTTASRVLNRGKHADRISEACAQRVREVASKLGYTLNYHARSMRLGRAEMIGVAMNLYDPLDHQVVPSAFGVPYFSWVLGGIEMRARKYNYRISVISADGKVSAPDKGMTELRQRRLDGMIIFGTVVAPGITTLLAEAPDAPVVVIQSNEPTQYPVVDFDDVAGVGMAINHLAQLGHKNLLWVGPAKQGGLAGGPNLREQHFISATWQAGLRGSSCRFALPEIPSDEWDVMISDGARESFARYLANNERTFTAIVCYNDYVALGVLAAIAEAGLRVPHDVSVIGFDDTMARYAYPRMTTISHKFGQMGAAACELMMQMVSDESARIALRGTRKVIDPELIVRQSTGVPPSDNS